MLRLATRTSVLPSPRSQEATGSWCTTSVRAIFLREAVPRMPLVVKVRGPHVAQVLLVSEAPQSREVGIAVAGGEVKELRLSMALKIATPHACSGTRTRVPCVPACALLWGGGG